MWITDETGRDFDLDWFVSLAQLRAELPGQTWITDRDGRDFDLNMFRDITELRVAIRTRSGLWAAQLPPSDRRTIMWDSVGLADLTRLPPDLTSWGRHWRQCWKVDGAVSRRGFACTRLAGHTGRHAAGDGSVIRAVWPR